ncbi:MAG: GNAT family N-acetyltransferase [Bacillota bacterium]
MKPRPLPGIEIREVSAEHIDSINIMCTVPGSNCSAFLQESARVHRHVATLGVKTFGAFQDGKPVGRMEIMPIDAAPMALSGDGLWVIRCLWVLEEAKGAGIARHFMNEAMKIARDSNGIAVVTYENWMPVSFFEKFGFEIAEANGPATLLLLKMSSETAVSFEKHFGRYRHSDTQRRRHPGLPSSQISDRLNANEMAHVTAVLTGRCPWLMQSWRHWLSVAKGISDKVVTSELIILTRNDAAEFGDENLYIDGVPYQGSPVQFEPFRQAIEERLAGRAKKYSNS